MSTTTTPTATISEVSQLEGEPPAHYEQGAAWYEASGRPHVLFPHETRRPAKVLVFYLTEPSPPVLTFDD